VGCPGWKMGGGPRSSAHSLYHSCPRVPHSSLVEPMIDRKGHKLKGTEEKVLAFPPFYDITDISFPRIQFQAREYPLLRLKLNALCSTLPQSNPPPRQDILYLSQYLPKPHTNTFPRPHDHNKLSSQMSLNPTPANPTERKAKTTISLSGTFHPPSPHCAVIAPNVSEKRSSQWRAPSYYSRE